LGLIKKIYNPTNSFSWFQYVSDPQEREELRNWKANLKKGKYFAKGLKMGYFDFNEQGRILANCEFIL
jgi:hypothetical protein